MLATATPAVTLRSAPARPFDGAIAAARTCYSPRVIGTDEITEKQRDTIGSRQFVWSFLHSYPFYNSEQSSQRYVKLKEPRAFVPPGWKPYILEGALDRARRLSAPA